MVNLCGNVDSKKVKKKNAAWGEIRRRWFMAYPKMRIELNVFSFRNHEISEEYCNTMWQLIPRSASPDVFVVINQSTTPKYSGWKNVTVNASPPLGGISIWHCFNTSFQKKQCHQTRFAWLISKLSCITSCRYKK